MYDDPTLDRRSVKCKVVMRFLGSIGKLVKVNQSHALTIADLNETHCEYIRNNYLNSSPVEMARVLFGNANLPVTSPQSRAVMAYCKQIDPNYRRGEELTESEYRAPSTIKQLVEKMDEYSMNVKDKGKVLFDLKNLSASDVKQLETLLANMQIPLFQIEAGKYTRKMDRVLFEFTFIWLCWNKPDLLQEEVHQYIAFAGETVKKNQIERTVQLLDDRLMEILNGDIRLNQAEVELLNSVREKANASMKQQAALLKALVGDRSKRMADKIQSSGSMHNLVEAWKNEDDRRRLIKLAQKMRESLKSEVERLSSMDSIRGELFGLNKDDIIL